MAEPAGDEDQLRALGYVQELSREMGGFHNFALSFSVISILTGGVTLYGHGLKYGGPLVMAAGWPLVVAFTFTVALSLAELASAFPTAGALYHWASLLGGRGAGWATAWLNTLGQFAMTAAIDYGLSEFLAALLGFKADRLHVLPLFALVLASHAWLNHVGVKVVARLNVVSAWYHLVGVLVMVGAVLFFAPRQPVSFLWTHTTVEGFSPAFGFLLALLQAGWTFTGYDASAHASEETHDAANNAPKGILLAVGVSAVAGYLMLLGVTLAVKDLGAATAAENPFIFILEQALGSWGTALVWVAVTAMWFCGLASVTSNSRMLYAFARDGGLPLSASVAQVSKRFKTPHVAVWVSAASAFLLTVLANAPSEVAAFSTVALYLSYGLPILAGLWRRRTGWPRVGPWNLGAWSNRINAVAVVWVVFMAVLMSLPVPSNGSAGLITVLTLTLLVAAWFGGVRRRFPGPRGLALPDR